MENLYRNDWLRKFVTLDIYLKMYLRWRREYQQCKFTE